MEYKEFAGMPDDARLWVYGFDRAIEPDTRAKVEADLSAFLRTWTSHGAAVDGAFMLVEDRFLLLAGCCEAGIGGCAIDESVGLVRSFKEKYGLDGFNRDTVFFRNEDGSIEVVTRESFQANIDEGRVDNNTVVFDVTLTNLKALRAGDLESTLESCWHARAFALK
jgi:hypothetical protein